jgi:hypothetical protein
VILPAPDESRQAPVRAVVLLLIGVAGLAMCLTLLFLGMRAVMDVGGYCAEGGPYAIEQHCPEGIPLAIVGSIFAGLASAAVATAGGVQIGGPYAGIAFLAWPALFISLGWNFLEYGLRPPGDATGPDLGWLTCGVVFVVMGAFPLLGFLPTRRARTVRDRVAMQRLLTDLDGRRRQLAMPSGPPAAPTPRMDLTSRLERLADLHRDGSLTDAEFEAAKRGVIAEVASGR